MTRINEKIEVVTVTEQRRRRWSTQEKADLVRLTYEPGMSVSLVARQHGVAVIFPTFDGHAKKAIMALMEVCHGLQGIHSV